MIDEAKTLWHSTRSFHDRFETSKQWDDRVYAFQEELKELYEAEDEPHIREEAADVIVTAMGLLSTLALEPGWAYIAEKHNVKRFDFWNAFSFFKKNYHNNYYEWRLLTDGFSWWQLATGLDELIELMLYITDEKHILKVADKNNRKTHATHVLDKESGKVKRRASYDYRPPERKPFEVGDTVKIDEDAFFDTTDENEFRARGQLGEITQIMGGYPYEVLVEVPYCGEVAVRESECEKWE